MTTIKLSIILFAIVMCIIGLTYRMSKYIDKTKKQHDKEIIELHDRITELEKQINDKQHNS